MGTKGKNARVLIASSKPPHKALKSNIKGERKPSFFSCIAPPHLCALLYIPDCTRGNRPKSNGARFVDNFLDCKNKGFLSGKKCYM